VWEESKAIRVSEQESLFHHTKEAEKILHYFETMPLLELLHQITSTVFCAILHTFKPPQTSVLSPNTKRQPSAITNTADEPPLQPLIFNTTRPLGMELEPCTNSYNEFVDVLKECWPEHYAVVSTEDILKILLSLQQLEHTAACSTSLLQKLPELPSVVRDLMAGRESPIPEKDRRAVGRLFMRADNGEFSTADVREHIIRCALKQQSKEGSVTLPNRMYAMISEEETKIATLMSLYE